MWNGEMERLAEGESGGGGGGGVDLDQSDENTYENTGFLLRRKDEIFYR